MNIELPQDVEFILQKLDERGFGAFIVGGCVRDSLMGVPPKDWDITTQATPGQVKEIFPHTHDTGLQHGTVTVVRHGQNYEVTTYRIDGAYSDNRHPDAVLFTDDLTEDLRRRDFTMNAIAYGEGVGFVDPFGGEADIKDKIIRGVGDPGARFQEDALRMLRAIRFSAQLGFEIERETWAAITRNAELIQNVSAERIRDEFCKTLMSEHSEKIWLAAESGLSNCFLPEFGALFTERRGYITEMLWVCEKDLIMRLTIFLRGTGVQTAEKILKAYRFDNYQVNTIKKLLEWFNPEEETKADFYSVRKAVSLLSAGLFEILLCLRKIYARARRDETALASLEAAEKNLRTVIAEGHCCSLKDLKINGDDLIGLGVPKGKAVGETLNELLELVLRKPEANEKEKLSEYVLTKTGSVL